jgi:adenosine deaminase
MTKEFQIAVDQFGLALPDLEKITMNSMKSALCTSMNASS